MSVSRFLFALSLASLVVGTIALGLYHEHYFVVFVFAVWLSVEFLVWRKPIFAKQFSAPTEKIPGSRLLLALYAERSHEADRKLLEKIGHLTLGQSLTHYELKWLERLKALVELRSLTFDTGVGGKRGLRQAFIYSKDPKHARAREGIAVTFPDLAESAMQVAGYYRKLFEAATGEDAGLSKVAQDLYGEIFQSRFEEQRGRVQIEALTDSIQRDGGMPFLILNLMRKGQGERARAITHRVITDQKEDALDEEIRTSLYWICEIWWFTHEQKNPIEDFESSVRYLYHLCFTHPERAGFLEIDSQFFSQFETINELAREGFLFKEILVEKILSLWKEHEGLFEDSFQYVLETMTGQHSKIYDSLEYWVHYWEREKDNFCREYLYVVEGNLCYAGKHFEEAATHYERALSLDTELRAALVNLPFVHAQVKDVEKHEASLRRLLDSEAFNPDALYLAGNSSLVLGDRKAAEGYFEKLKNISGWEAKADHYASTFCYEHGRFEDALYFAQQAHKSNPNDMAYRYHLSLCYNAVGEKDKALEMVKKVGSGPEWLDYYRFTLERDSGRHGEASQTLLNLPSEYFEDPEELDAAVSFAKLRRDLVLLRHLKKSAN